MSLLEVKNLKVHFPVKHGMFSHDHVFASLTPLRVGLNFPA
ncbi:MAG TPA: hypothetical protein VJT54_05955 [Verrucomicrobiae bacterium]|nr:hypothetical protein [Verrucomicrobiae bacterium]